MLGLVLEQKYILNSHLFWGGVFPRAIVIFISIAINININIIIIFIVIFITVIMNIIIVLILIVSAVTREGSGQA